MKNLSVIAMLGLIFFFPLTGCLQTRSSVKESEQKQVLQQQVVSLQRDTAESSNRVGEFNEQIRELRGRIEVVENRTNAGSNEMERAQKSLHDQNQESSRRVALLQESITRMDSQIQVLNAEVTALRAEVAAKGARDSAPAVSPASKKDQKDQFEIGQAHFAKKEWKKAILSFQKYREKNSKGKKANEATYLMGVSFQELGMKDEARTFFEEVVANAPNSSEAKKSRTRLKSLKK
jgi:TolA-binding protein